MGERLQVPSTDRVVVIDLETTGFSPLRGHRIIEIGAVALQGGGVIGEFHSLIDPGRSVPLAAVRVHGITEAQLQGQPTAAEVLPRLHRFLDGSPLVAHNAPFDINFLRHEFARFGLGVTPPCHCTLRLCRRLFPRLPNHRLETVSRHLFGDTGSGPLHRALADARLTARVWMAMGGGKTDPDPMGGHPNGRADTGVRPYDDEI